MAKEPGQEGKGAQEDDLLYQVWLRNGWERLSNALGRRLAVVLLALAGVFLVVLAVGAVGLAAGLIWYLAPIFAANNKLSISERKDLVQGFASVAQAAAVGLTGAAGFIGLAFTWRNLRQTRESTQRTLELTEQGQITERFTRAIDQLGVTDDDGNPRLEVRLGGIYALERIDKESPERAYHSTVMEVLTAYVRENAPWPPKSSKSSEGSFVKPPGEGSVSDAESDETAEQDKGTEQDAEPTQRSPSNDIQAILDVLKRREEERVPEDHRVRLNLREADLQGADLKEADLREANLQRARLVLAGLQGADLQGADLQGADLQEAELNKADFRGAKLNRADLQGAILWLADLTRANLHGAILLKANLRGAILWLADLQEAILWGADLQRANLQEAKLNKADFRGADLQDTNLKKTNFRGADLKRADLKRANFSGADLQGAGLQGAKLNRANLRGANLRGTDLQEAILREADLTAANLQEINLQGADLKEAIFRGADLQEAILREADLQGAHGMTQEQINGTIGSYKIKLPAGLNCPKLWSKSFEEQTKILQERFNRTK